MLIDTQELAERLHSGCDGLGVAREVAAVIDLMQHRLGIGIMRLDGNKRQGMVTVEAGLGPGCVPWGVSSVHGGLR
ncbi:hypothetical protein D3C71_1238840 [compost metagenome]